MVLSLRTEAGLEVDRLGRTARIDAPIEPAPVLMRVPKTGQINRVPVRVKCPLPWLGIYPVSGGRGPDARSAA